MTKMKGNWRNERRQDGSFSPDDFEEINLQFSFLYIDVSLLWSQRKDLVQLIYKLF